MIPDEDDGGPLSPAERALMAPATMTESEREMTEELLYFQLVVAGQRRAQLNRMGRWSQEYVAAHRDHELALSRASEHIERLTSNGGQLSPLLESMARQEGLTP